MRRIIFAAIIILIIYFYFFYSNSSASSSTSSNSIPNSLPSSSVSAVSTTTVQTSVKGVISEITLGASKLLTAIGNFLNPNLAKGNLTPIAAKISSDGSITITSAVDQTKDVVANKIAKAVSLGPTTIQQQQNLQGALNQGIIPDASFSLDNNAPGGTLAQDNINAETNIPFTPRISDIGGGIDFGGFAGADGVTGGTTIGVKQLFI